jgi:hypothetical protein
MPARQASAVPPAIAVIEARTKTRRDGGHIRITAPRGRDIMRRVTRQQIRENRKALNIHFLGLCCQYKSTSCAARSGIRRNGYEAQKNRS